MAPILLVYITHQVTPWIGLPWRRLLHQTLMVQEWIIIIELLTHPKKQDDTLDFIHNGY